MVDLVKQVYDDIGPVGGNVCNAGTAVSKSALEMTREDFDSQFSTNVWGVFNACQACTL
jgi:sorbose reductase